MLHSISTDSTNIEWHSPRYMTFTTPDSAVFVMPGFHDQTKIEAENQLSLETYEATHNTSIMVIDSKDPQERGLRFFLGSTEPSKPEIVFAKSIRFFPKKSPESTCLSGKIKPGSTIRMGQHQFTCLGEMSLLTTKPKGLDEEKLHSSLKLQNNDSTTTVNLYPASKKMTVWKKESFQEDRPILIVFPPESINGDNSQQLEPPKTPPCIKPRTLACICLLALILIPALIIKK